MKDEFVWEGSSREECVVVVPVQGIAVYLNAEGDVVIRQQALQTSQGDQEDQFVVVPVSLVQTLLSAVRRAVSDGKKGGDGT